MGVGWVQDSPEEVDEGGRHVDVPPTHPVTPPLREQGHRSKRCGEQGRGFHTGCAKLRCPRQPSSHTQKVTGCLDLERGSSQGSTGRGEQQRSGQQNLQATCREG